MTELIPPKADRKDHKITYHGHEFVDSYFWLRNKESPEVLNYLNSENEYSKNKMSFTDQLQEDLYNEMVTRTKEDDESVPEKNGPYYYYYRIEKGKNYRIYCRRKNLDSKSTEEIILDLNTLAEGKKFFSLGDYDISQDHKLIAYSVDYSGYENYLLFVKNLETKDVYSFEISELSDTIIWGTDNNTIFYCKRDKIHRSSFVYKTRLEYINIDPEKKNFSEELLYYEPDEMFSTVIKKSKDNRYLFITSDSKETSEVRFFDFKSNKINLFRERSFSVIYFLYHRNDHFYILSNEKAINFKVLKVKVDNYQDTHLWEEIIPENQKVKIDSLEMFNEFIVVHNRKNGLKNLTIFSEEGNSWHDIEFKEPIYTLNNRNSPSNYEFNSTVFRFYYESMKTPKTVYDCDMKSKTLVVKKQDEIYGGFDTSNYEMKREFVKAIDGVKIPISIIYSKNMIKNGSSPLFLYGYGSYGIAIDPGFNTHAFSLIDRGFIFVIAHIRGGGEMGRPWYLDGKYLKKKNTFTDFIAVAEYLIAEKYTNSAKLAISGGSAGGLLIGSVINMRPDLFKVAKLNVPFVDVINTMMDASIPLTTFEYEEWGNPNNKEFFDYMLSYSPYDNLKAQDYPHILVTAGLNDPRVHYWEPAKYVSKLRYLKTDLNDLLFKINMGAGHAGASGKYIFLKELAFEYAFVLSYINK
jgi:oligopeptidase B